MSGFGGGNFGQLPFGGLPGAPFAAQAMLVGQSFVVPRLTDAEMETCEILADSLVDADLFFNGFLTVSIEGQASVSAPLSRQSPITASFVATSSIGGAGGAPFLSTPFKPGPPIPGATPARVVPPVPAKHTYYIKKT